MPFPTTTPRIHHFIKLCLQLGLIFLAWWSGNLLQQVLHLPVSGAVTGLILLLLALFSGILRLEWIKSGADLLLGELVLFFIPCFVGLLKFKALLLHQGWQLLIVIALGTLVVMAVTGFSVHIGFQLENWWKNRHQTIQHRTVYPAEKGE